MSDIRRKKLADILVNYSVEVKPGDWVIIMGGLITAPLVNDVVEKTLLAGGYPSVMFESEQVHEILLRTATEEQLKWVAPFMIQGIQEADVFISLRGAHNTRYQTGIDPTRDRIRRLAQKEIMQVFNQRAAAGELRWTTTQYPCHAFAQEADMSLGEYEDFVYAATFADQEDPVAEWRKVHAEQARYVEWLKGRKQVVVRGPHVDLRLSIEGRTFINSDGRRNMPSGEIFTGPVEDSVQGWIEFSYPAITNGREVEGIRLAFEDGKVVAASAEKNADFLVKMLDSDEGSRYLGEFAIGTNYGIRRFTKSILFDEKIGGTIHLAVGNGYLETGSQNKSSIHWDMICDMRDDSEILVDGELFYKNGEFMV
jgi:aminopeptidase